MFVKNIKLFVIVLVLQKVMLWHISCSHCSRPKFECASCTNVTVKTMKADSYGWKDKTLTQTIFGKTEQKINVRLDKCCPDSGCKMLF